VQSRGSSYKKNKAHCCGRKQQRSGGCDRLPGWRKPHRLHGGGVEKVLKEKGEGNQYYGVVALGGTSDGAICALLTWYGLLPNHIDKAVELLDSFWRDNSARSYGDKLLNDWLLRTNRFFENAGGSPTLSPYYYPS
jgi:NTE family protein